MVRMSSSLRPFIGVVGSVALLAVAGCASTFEPKAADTVPFQERSQTQEKGGVAVTVAVPSASESKDLFGVSLYSKRVQPVWIEIENHSDQTFTFLPLGTDADYFTPIEAASVYGGRRASTQAEQFFFSNSVDANILPGTTREGFLFTNLDEGTKAFNVDLVGDASTRKFTFFVPVPGLRIDHHEVNFKELYEQDQVQSFDNPGDFMAAINTLACCATDAAAAGTGDPLNLVIVGEPDELYYAFLRSGWDETEAISTASSFKTAMSFITGGEYRYSPVSNLFVFGRSQDAAFQKIRKNINERNHLRIWLAPIRYQGKSVWIGQISRDIGVRFTKKTITTHKIDPDVDETREFLLENLAYSQALSKFAYVEGVGAAPIEEPRGNLTGDPYFTDGLRVVLWVSSESVSSGSIEFLPWIPQSELVNRSSE